MIISEQEPTFSSDRLQLLRVLVSSLYGDILERKDSWHFTYIKVW